jgi:hypothetical protein
MRLYRSPVRSAKYDPQRLVQFVDGNNWWLSPSENEAPPIRHVTSNELIVTSTTANKARIIQLLAELTSSSDDFAQTCVAADNDGTPEQRCTVKARSESKIKAGVGIKSLSTVLTDNFSQTSLDYSRFLLHLIENLFIYQSSEKTKSSTLELSDQMVSKLEVIKRQLLRYRGYYTSDEESLSIIFIECFRNLLLFHILKPLSPMSDAFLSNNNITGLTRKTLLHDLR